MSDKTDALKKILLEVAGLKRSPLYEYRTKNHYFPVIGEGSHDSRIMFIGEAPGQNEAKTGRPFCGAAGRLLDKLLASVSIPRSEVYITNIVKDRPPDNRDPKPDEIELYAPYLIRQIDIIKPQVLATLGRFSMAFIMQKFGLESQLASITLLHGKLFAAEASYGVVHILPLYHPAVAIYDNKKYPELEKDFLLLKNFA